MIGRPVSSDLWVEIQDCINYMYQLDFSDSDASHIVMLMSDRCRKRLWDGDDRALLALVYTAYIRFPQEQYASGYHAYAEGAIWLTMKSGTSIARFGRAVERNHKTYSASEKVLFLKLCDLVFPKTGKTEGAAASLRGLVTQVLREFSADPDPEVSRAARILLARRDRSF